jgi:hypothetical protein
MICNAMMLRPENGAPSPLSGFRRAAASCASPAASATNLAIFVDLARVALVRASEIRPHEEGPHGAGIATPASRNSLTG